MTPTTCAASWPRSAPRPGARSRRRRPARSTTYLAGRKLVDFSGPHGWEKSSRSLGRVAARRRLAARGRRRQAARRCSRSSSCARRSRCSRRRARRRRPRRARRRLGRAWSTRPAGGARRGHAVFHGYAGRRHRRASSRPRRTTRSPSATTTPTTPSYVAPAVATLRSRRHRGPVRAGARAALLHGRHRDHRARRLPGLRAPQADPGRPGRVGARRSTARSSSACAAATSSWSSGRTSRSATASHTADAVQLYFEESITLVVVDDQAAVHLAYPS